MKHIITLFLLLFTLPSLAQNPMIGIKSGVSWSNIFSNEFDPDYYRTGFTGGITYEQQLKNGILVGAELLYQQRGYKVYSPGDYEMGNNAGVYKFYDNYIAVPIKVGYTTGNKLTGFANIGLVPAVLIESKAIWLFPAGDYAFDLSEYTKKMDLAGLAEVGGNLKISDRLLISTSFAFQYSFTSYYKSDDARHYSMVLCGGVKYAL